MYSHDRSVCSAAGKYVDRSLECINRSQTHECGTGLGAISFQMGMHKWDFRCSVVIKKCRFIHFLCSWLSSRQKMF